MKRQVNLCCGHATCQRLVAEAIEAGVRAALEERARILDTMPLYGVAAQIVRSDGPAEVLAQIRGRSRQ